MIRFFAAPVVLALTLGLAGCARESRNASSSSAATITGASTKLPLLINITHGRADLHAASMGLSLAQAALDKGHPVTVLLNVDAPVLAAKDLPADVKFADFPPVSEMVRAVLAKGGKVLVCGHCAAVHKLDAAAMQPGVTLTHRGEWIDDVASGTVSVSY